jgi:hypothetical protein
VVEIRKKDSGTGIQKQGFRNRNLVTGIQEQGFRNRIQEEIQDEERLGQVKKKDGQGIHEEGTALDYSIGEETKDKLMRKHQIFVM